MYDFLSFRWFEKDTLFSFDWVHPVFLYFIFFIPVIYFLRWLLGIRKKRALSIALFKSELRTTPITYLRFIPSFFMQLALALFFIALARPQKTNKKVETWSEGIDIILILDISESMQIQDFTPNRLAASKKVSIDFINGRLEDRIGLVIFSGEAISYAPLTTDYSFLKKLIDDIYFDMITASGTAIGSAIAVGINRIEKSQAKSKIIILLSDGENTAGEIDPLTMAQLAYGYQIKIYTIGIGKEGRVPWGVDSFGRTQYIEQTLDEVSLKRIADITDGKYFRATDNQALSQVFASIDALEKTEIKETTFESTKDYFYIYMTWGMLFLLVHLLCKSTFIVNILED